MKKAYKIYEYTHTHTHIHIHTVYESQKKRKRKEQKVYINKSWLGMKGVAKMVSSPPTGISSLQVFAE